MNAENSGVFRVWSEQYDHRRRRRVLLLVEKPDGTEYLGKLEFTLLEPYAALGHDDGSVSGRTINGVNGDIFLQTILDHAWEIGMRPVGFNDTTQQVGALRDHLHDLRALIFRGDVKPKE